MPTKPKKVLCFSFIMAILTILIVGNAGSAENYSYAAQPPTIEGCPILPTDNVWNTPIDNMPVDSNSSAYITTIGSSTGLHPDFGSGTWDGEPIGIPYNIVPGTQPKVSITFDYSDESDPGPYPIPPDPLIEGGSQSTGDRHVLVLDKDNCVLYETWSTYPQPDGSWHAGSGAIFNLLSNALRPSGWTSADAAGLPILPGLVRYNEVASGEIAHAVRFTAPQTRQDFIWPARHFASSLTASNYPPMGQRFRLKAGFDISGFSAEVQVILQALKKYGMILADNGSSWFISGVPDSGWNNDILVPELSQVTGSNFEAVDESSLMIDADSGQARQGTEVYVTLTIVKSGTGSGTVLSSDGLINCGSNCSEDYLSGTVLTLTATAYADSLFTGWSGGGCTGMGSCKLTMSQVQTVSASFANNSPIISVSPASLDFGNVHLNKSLSKTVNINNTGGANLIVTGVEITGSASSEFLAKWTGTQTIKHGGAYSLRITFRPVTLGSKIATVVIHSNDPVTPVTHASLKGVGK